MSKAVVCAIGVMDNYWQLLLELTLGITLSAAVGFRVFVPPLVLSLASIYGHIQLAPQFEWVGSYEALVLLAIATAAEIIAYYIPFVDNLLDTVQIPLAMVIGTLVTASSIQSTDPVLQWTMAIIAGGGASTAVVGLNSLARLTLTGLTGGLGNFLLATGEAISATALSLIVVVAPVLAPIALIIVISAGIYLLLNYQKLKEQLFAKNAKSAEPAD